jgi:hypothetical protein
VFTEFSLLTVRTDQRREDLLAEAEGFRLARLARAHRRSRSRATTAHADPPGAPPQRPVPAQRNDDANRRYAVSR